MKKSLDPAIIKKALRGDEDAFALIYGELRDPIHNFSLRLTGNSEAAVEITQDTFIHLITSPDSFDPAKGALKSFLFGIARNKCLNHLRAVGRFVDVDVVDYDKEDPYTPLNEMLEKELFQTVSDSLAMLAPLQREAVLLRELECLSYAEIANITGTEVGVVKSRIFRARKTLSKHLSEYMTLEEKEAYEVR